MTASYQRDGVLAELRSCDIPPCTATRGEIISVAATNLEETALTRADRRLKTTAPVRERRIPELGLEIRCVGIRRPVVVTVQKTELALGDAVDEPVGPALPAGPDPPTAYLTG